MSDLSIEYQNIVKMVAEKHTEFIKKFGDTITMLDGSHTLSTTRIAAKLDLLIKAYVKAGVIDKVMCGAVSSSDAIYPMSFGVERKGCPASLYLLNTGKDVIVSDCVGLAQKMDTLDGRIVIVRDTKRVCKRFSNVLSPDFDWSKMAEFVLEAIHEVMYESDEVRRIKVLETLAT
jgi:hypothetical protein